MIKKKFVFIHIPPLYCVDLLFLLLSAGTITYSIHNLINLNFIQ